MNRESGIIIYGAGGHGRVVLDILLRSGADVLGFLDDDIKKTGQEIRGFKVLSDWSWVEDKALIRIALGIGNNRVRAKIFKKAKDRGIEVVSAIHPGAIVSEGARIGEGVVIMPGAVINPGTVLEDGVVVNTGATVDHDCRLERFCQIWPGANLAGAVRVGEFSYVGTGASIIPNIKIGKNVMIGAGAALICDVPDNVTVAGNPGKVIKKNG
jgi:sugar O-acyltransferase (sialic acid O-acetyltransferase NeuD family)